MASSLSLCYDGYKSRRTKHVHGPSPDKRCTGIRWNRRTPSGRGLCRAPSRSPTSVSSFPPDDAVATDLAPRQRSLVERFRQCPTTPRPRDCWDCAPSRGTSAIPLQLPRQPSLVLARYEDLPSPVSFRRLLHDQGGTCRHRHIERWWSISHDASSLSIWRAQHSREKEPGAKARKPEATGPPSQKPRRSGRAGVQ
jgi:hypothetical protein